MVLTRIGGPEAPAWMNSWRSPSGLPAPRARRASATAGSDASSRRRVIPDMLGIMTPPSENLTRPLYTLDDGYAFDLCLAADRRSGSGGRARGRTAAGARDGRRRRFVARVSESRRQA